MLKCQQISQGFPLGTHSSRIYWQVKRLPMKVIAQYSVYNFNLCDLWQERTHNVRHVSVLAYSVSAFYIAFIFFYGFFSRLYFAANLSNVVRHLSHFILEKVWLKVTLILSARRWKDYSHLFG